MSSVDLIKKRRVPQFCHAPNQLTRLLLRIHAWFLRRAEPQTTGAWIYFVFLQCNMEGVSWLATLG